VGLVGEKAVGSLQNVFGNVVAGVGAGQRMRIRRIDQTGLDLRPVSFELVYARPENFGDFFRRIKNRPIVVGKTEVETVFVGTHRFEQDAFHAEAVRIRQDLICMHRLIAKRVSKRLHEEQNWRLQDTPWKTFGQAAREPRIVEGLGQENLQGAAGFRHRWS